MAINKTHPDIYNSLCEQGIREVSASEFARLKADAARATIVQRSFNVRSTTVDTPLTPAPSPTPVPSLYETKERGVREKAISADSACVSERAAQPEPVGLETASCASVLDDSRAPEARLGNAGLTTPIEDLIEDPDNEPVRVEPVIVIDQEREREREQEPMTMAGAKPRHAQAATPSGHGPSTQAEMPAVPDWLPDTVWQAFIDHRRTLKKPLTPAAAVLTLRQLEKAKGFGHDPVELVITAIATGWQGCVYPDKHFQPPATRTGGAHPARNGTRRPLREPTANPADYLQTAGFVTELEVPA